MPELENSPLRSNKYPGYCYVCTKPVAANAGLLVKIKGGSKKFYVRHNECSAKPDELPPYIQQEGAPQGKDIKLDVNENPDGSQSISLLDLDELFVEPEPKPELEPSGAQDKSKELLKMLGLIMDSPIEHLMDAQGISFPSESEPEPKPERQPLDEPFATIVKDFLPVNPASSKTYYPNSLFLVRFLGSTELYGIPVVKLRANENLSTWLLKLNGYAPYLYDMVPSECHVPLMVASHVLRELYLRLTTFTDPIGKLSEENRSFLMYNVKTMAYITLNEDWSPYLDKSFREAQDSLGDVKLSDYYDPRYN